MHMESPERHLFGACIEGQESPLFNFLFTLSPIKPIKSLHASQSFTELSFPPPPPVFVTPKVHVKSSLHRNSHKSEQPITLTHSDSMQNNGEEGVSCVEQRSTESQNKSTGLLCSGPSDFVRMEFEATSTCSMDIEKKDENTICSLGYPETLQNSQPSERSNVVHLCSEALDIDKGAAILMPLLSEVPEKTAALHESLEGGQKVISCTLLDTFDQHTSGYHHAFCGSVDKSAQGEQVDPFLIQMSTGCGDGESTNVFREQQDGVANKVNYPVQRGFRRRCLDFRASDCRWTSKGMAALKSRQSKSCSRSQNAATYSSDQDTHVRILNERTLETSDAISSDSMPANSRLLMGQSDLDDHQLHATCPPCGASPSPPNILSGIGLHLNSLTGSVPVLQSSRGGDGTYESVKFSSAMVGARSQSQIGLADKYGVISHLANFENSVQSEAIFDGDLVVSVAEKTELVACKDHISSASESMSCVGSDSTSIRQPKEYASSKARTRLPVLLDQQERVLLQAEERQTDLDRGQDTTSSAKNIRCRKRALTVDSFGDGCKRCNCKKSKCLKLYCECFAAGLFCIDSCSCHDCHNKPSYEAMVLETRQNIQSRNPLAFAPKVMRTVTNSPTIGETAIDVTPASARHKKGCSCRKSKCLKKYCECYQEGVGCSEGCRCENCENLYGKKEECSDGRDVGEDLSGKEVTTEKINTSSFCNEFDHAASYRQDDLTPTTPSFQYAGTNDSSTRYQSSTRRRSSNKGVQSPDSLLTFTKPSKTVAQPLRSSKAARNNFEVYKISRQLPSSRGRLPRAIKSGQFSPRWEGLDDICTLTPLPQAPLPPTTPCVSFAYCAVSSPSLNVPEGSDPASSCCDTVCNVNVGQCSSPTKSHQISDLTATKHCGRTPTDSQAMPDTPMANTPFCGMGLESPYEDTMFFCTEAGGSSGEDAIPAILKDPEPAHSSMFCLKSNSPKQKRVSPPHFVGSRITSQGRGQSPALRNGRKFTLQSVSSVSTTKYPAM